MKYWMLILWTELILAVKKCLDMSVVCLFVCLFFCLFFCLFVRRL